MRTYRNIQDDPILMLYGANSVALFDESSQNAMHRSNPIKVLMPSDIERKLDPDETEVLATSSMSI